MFRKQNKTKPDSSNYFPFEVYITPQSIEAGNLHIVKCKKKKGEQLVIIYIALFIIQKSISCYKTQGFLTWTAKLWEHSTTANSYTIIRNVYQW